MRIPLNCHNIKEQAYDYYGRLLWTRYFLSLLPFPKKVHKVVYPFLNYLYLGVIITQKEREQFLPYSIFGVKCKIDIC